MTRILSKRTLLVLVTTVYVVWMISYYHTLFTRFGIVVGYPYRDVPTGWEIYATATALLPCLYINMGCRRPSDFIIVFVYFAMFLPSMIIPFYALSIDYWDIGLFNIFALGSFSLAILAQRIPLLSISRPRMREEVYKSAIGLITIVISIVLIVKLGLNVRLPSLAEIYDVREIYKGELSKLGGFTIYIMLWSQFLIMPLLLVIGFRSFRARAALQGFVFVTVGVLLGLYVFSVSAIKSSLVSVMFCGGVWFLVRQAEGFSLRIAYAILLLCFSSNLIAMLTDFDFMYLHLIRRVLVTPGLNTGFYLEFFGSNDKMMLSHSVFSTLVNGLYDMSPGHVIGAHYSSGSGNMTAGYIADAYANFGLFGMLIFGGLLGLVLWVTDSVSAHLDRQTAVTVFAVHAYALVNSGLLTTLLSYGLILMLLAVYMMPGKMKHVDSKLNYAYA